MLDCGLIVDNNANGLKAHCAPAQERIRELIEPLGGAAACYLSQGTGRTGQFIELARVDSSVQQLIRLFHQVDFRDGVAESLAETVYKGVAGCSRLGRKVIER